MFLEGLSTMLFTMPQEQENIDTGLQKNVLLIHSAILVIEMMRCYPCDNMYTSGDQFVKGHQPDSGKQVLNDFYPYVQSEKFPFTDTECKVVIPRDHRGKSWGGEPDTEVNQ